VSPRSPMARLMRTSLLPLTLTTLVTLAGASCAPAGDLSPAGQSLEERARAIHERVMTLDTHVDIDPENFLPDTVNYTRVLNGTQVDLPSMEEGGLDAVFFSLYQGQQQDFTPEGYQAAFDTAMAKVEAVERLTMTLAPDRIELALTAADARRIFAAGKKVAFMGMENGYALGEDVSNVQRFADRGMRYLSLAHNGHNQLSDSHTGEADGVYRWDGLSPLGREVVAEANRLGVVLDVSHPSKAANLETMALSRAPVMASHSAARALADHSRNMDDELLLALRDNEGVIQVVAFPGYVKINPPQPDRQQAIDALREEFGLPAGGRGRGGRGALDALTPGQRARYDERMAGIDADFPVPPPANVADFIDHIDYVVDLIGIDHVGISSETFNVTLELVRRGYTEEEISKIWSGNLLRVLEEAERVAAGE
jgi:membrane dipeptidase